MPDSDPKKPLPPGSTGWPILGETLRFLDDQFHFVASRIEQHGPVFRSKILGRDTVVLAGPEATEVFNDEDRVVRSGAMPPHVEQFFGGVSLPLLDGAEHRARKQQVMGAFTREALASYVPAMQEATSKALERWSLQAEVSASHELKRLALELIGGTMLSLPPGEDLDTVLESFLVLSKGFASLPIPLPGTAFSSSLKARDRILAVLRRCVAEHRAKPFNDGLGRMLETAADDGSKISDEGAVLELHHFNIAGYLVFTQLATVLLELDKREDVRKNVLAEIGAHAASGPITVQALAKTPYLHQVVKEVKRTTPFVPTFFGRARRDFELNGYLVPEGFMILWAQHATNHFGATFADPNTFDPDRFSPARAEDTKHPHGFAPQGSGDIRTGHKCAGYDFSTLFIQVFTMVLLRDYSWQIPEQNLGYLYGLVPPELADGLRVSFKRR